MVPLVKGYSTEMSIEVASLGVQVHGGMGFIEETGAAQYLRDARILTIYEGTTGDPGQRPGRAQDRARRRPRRQGDRRAGRRRPKPSSRASDSAAARVDDEAPAARRARRSSDVVDFVVAPEQGQPERGVRRLGAVPDARRQPGRRLADGARAAGRRATARRTAKATPPSCTPRSRPRASTPSTC